MGEEWNDMANEHWHGVPEGTLNLLPRAGDIVVMSECLSRQCTAAPLRLLAKPQRCWLLLCRWGAAVAGDGQGPLLPQPALQVRRGRREHGQPLGRAMAALAGGGAGARHAGDACDDELRLRGALGAAARGNGGAEAGRLRAPAAVAARVWARAVRVQ